MSQLQELFIKAQSCLAHSYSPYSNYQVGASILCDNGTIYTGTNIENVSYGLTICAEASAISQMICDGGKKIKALLVLANHDRMCTPCGACRQRLAEFGRSDTIIYMCNKAEILEIVSLSSLLPFTFKEQNIKR